MEWLEWMLAPLKKYADFSGRARRKEYWMFCLGVFVVNMVLGIIFPTRYSGIGALWSSLGAIISSLFSLAILLPSIAVGVRRLHDIGKSGANYCWVFLPIIGWIILIIYFAKEGEPGGNQYGPNPKE